MKKILETKRCYLREITHDDLEVLRSVFSDPLVMEFSLKGALNDEEIKKVIDSSLKRYKDDGVGFWAACLKESNEFIGIVGLPIQEVEGERFMEIGYRLAQNHWKQGYATEICIACRDYAFNVLGRDHVISIIDPKNKNSINVAKRVGMTKEREAIVWGFHEHIYGMKKT